MSCTLYFVLLYDLMYLNVLLLLYGEMYSVLENLLLMYGVLKEVL